MQMQTQYLIRFFCATAAVLGLVAGFNFLVDPLQIFHAPWVSPARYTSNQRIGDAGLIRSQQFDTVFMGTSLGVRFRQSEIDERLGGKSLNLSFSGGTSKEQYEVLSAALSHHPKRIIWQLDDWMFRDSANDVEAYMPADLYRMNLAGFAKYLFSLETARESAWVALSRWDSIQKQSRGLFALGFIKFDQTDASAIGAFPSYIDPATVFNATKATEAFEQNLKSPHTISGGFEYAPMVANFDGDAIGLIKDHPDTRFIVYFPPYSILHWKALRDVAPKALQDVFRFNEYQLEQLSRLPNVALYDFRDVDRITHDLNNYVDTVHHSLEVDRQILASIAAGHHLVDRSSPAASIERLNQQVERYGITASPPPE